MKRRRAWVREGLGTFATLHARRLMGSLEPSSRSAGHAARVACFLGFFFRAFGVLV